MAQKRDAADHNHVVATNRKAFAHYEILETVEAGVCLVGPEVKSLRGGTANIQDGYVRFDRGEAWLLNAYIPPYALGSLHVEQEPTRTRRLLLNQSEIKKWLGRTTIKGLTVIPLELYFNARGRVKVKLALGRGKDSLDRREDIKRRSVDREMRRAYAEKQKIK